MQPWLPRGFEFLAGIPEPERQRRLLVTIQAYIDDSGVLGTHPIFTFAGFIGVAETWAEFSSAWRDHLKAPPSVRYLKMAEAAKLKGQFKFWKPGERDDKIRGFIEVIRRHPPQKAIHATIVLADFKRHMLPHLRGHRVPMSDPFFVGCNAILAGAGHEVLDSGLHEKLEVIFDEHLIFAPRVKLWYPLIKAGMQHRTDFDLGRLYTVLPSEPMFKDDKEYLPLQSADMLAWLCRTSFSDDPTEFEWVAHELMQIVPMSQYHAFFDAARMQRIHADSLKMTYPPELIRAWQEQMGLKKPKSKH